MLVNGFSRVKLDLDSASQVSIPVKNPGSQLFSQVNTRMVSDQTPAKTLDNPTKVKAASPTQRLVFKTPPTSKGTVICVFDSCVEGRCGCIHMVGDIRAQLKPCRFAASIFQGTEDPTDKYWELFEGIVEGFDIVDTPVPEYDCTNYNSILCEEARQVMNKNVLVELAEGRISVAREKPTCVHALGAVPKQGGGFRTITDCSRPEGLAVNNYSPSLAPTFKFKQLNYITDRLHAGAYMSVIDIKSAYRAVSVNPKHWEYQGFRWKKSEEGESVLYTDHRMCFGHRTAPYYFDMISNFNHEQLTKDGEMTLMNYMDDYLVVASSYEGCIAAQNKVTSYLRYLGFHVAWSKVTSPSTTAKYLGIIIDSEKMELRIPKEKMEKLKSLLKKYSKARSISKRDLESLTGLLAHCCQCVQGGRIFSRRLYSLYSEMIRTGRKHIGLSKAAREDLVWWTDFSNEFNGTSLIVNITHEEPIYSDASMEGFAAAKGPDWVAGNWTNDLGFTSPTCSHSAEPPPHASYDHGNINELELWAVVVAIDRWKSLLKDRVVTMYIDNTQVIYSLRSGRSVNPTSMNWIRKLFWTCASSNIVIDPQYVRSEDNIVADTLSRLPYRRYRNAAVALLSPYQLCCNKPLFDYCRSDAGITDRGYTEVEAGVGGTIDTQSEERPMEMLPQVLQGL